MIEQMRNKYSVKELCTALSVSRSGYHAWKVRKPGKREQENQKLVEAIKEVHEHRFKRAYGSPRMTTEMKDLGFDCSENRVARHMKKACIQGKSRRPFRPKTTRADSKAKASPNELAQQDPPTQPGQQVVSDITYIPTREGWLYLTVVLDLFSRAILGWDLSESLAADAVGRSLYKTQAWPCLSTDTLFHSDRGCQYTSQEVRKILQQAGWTQSMSAKGYCYDNAYAESFFASFKCESLPDSGIFETKQQARRTIFDYIESFYNRSRQHSGIGSLSPVKFLELYFQNQNLHIN